ncbi:hypothetical protein GCM10010329_81060 [Streptomyces spiroverticillatus]|nr:hypothetical protein [Streptomyces finlayi]GHA46283.1 hypothetical protein GCM10010329_81060 [Streptomyces spiroverticillatus]
MLDSVISVPYMVRGKLEKVVEVLQEQAWELTFLHDELLHQIDE